MPGNRMIKGQPHSLAYMTGQEMDAMNELRREPGLRGRLARKGAKKKMEFVDGVPSFAPFMNATSNAIAEQVETDRRSQQAYDDAVAAQRAGNPGGSSDGGSRAATPMTREQAMQQYGLFDQGQMDAAKKKAGEDRLNEFRGERRQQLTDEFGGYKTGFKDLENQYDLSAERTATRGLAGEAKQLGTQFGSDMSGVQNRLSGMQGYESDVAGLRGDVAGLREQQAGLGDRMGQLAQQAQDPNALQRDRGMYAGMLEQQRRGSDKAAMAELNRSGAGSGMSPQQMALARAQLKQGQGEGARGDLLRAAQMSQQGVQSQLGQAANLYGQQGNMGMQQANLLGQQAGLSQAAQGLGSGLAGQQAGLYAQNAGFQSGLLGQRGGFQGQSANLLNQQMMRKAGLMGQQVGMSEAQLQDVVAQQNQAFEKEMAEKGYAMQRDAARMSRPQGPSTMDQVLGVAQAAAPFAMMAMSDKNLKKNIKSARDKDLLSPKEIDGFLDSLYAHQYNYKDGKHGKGKQVGVMAQDLEKTQLGKQMVEDTTEGKRVNFGKGLGLVVASQARLNERLNSIGA